jgi:Zn-dependent protease
MPPPLPAPAEPAQANGWRKNIGSIVLGAGLLFVKFKAILLGSLGFVASIWFYGLFWGWQFGLVFVLLILVHELGHAAVMRVFGVPASLPYFIPGLGALISMKGRPASALQEAYIALAGPLFGTLAALACLLYGEATDSTFWVAAAYTGFFLNLFNLAPVMPLDGARVVGAVSPRIWIFGLVAMVVGAFAFHWWNPLLLVLVVLSIPQVIAAWNGTTDPAYYALSPLQRGGVAAAYFALAAFLFVAMLSSHVAVPQQGTVPLAS